MHREKGSGAINRARQLRQNRTDAEGLLWWKLREYNRHGYQFRRQAPVCGYFLDFAEHRSHVAIELDGSQHGTDAGVARDAVRDSKLDVAGYRVLRFWNIDVWKNLDGVVEAIIRTVDNRTPTRIASLSDLPSRGR
jgi:crossover junction endodeoxyribonuclease RuvC/BirA family biotin operon repressor/biotin-[acetyl-CoA-carboxylase] ligase